MPKAKRTGHKHSCCLWCKKFSVCKERPSKGRQACPAPKQRSPECLVLIREGFCTVCPSFEEAPEVQASMADDVLTAHCLMSGRRGMRPKWPKKSRAGEGE